MPSGAVASGDVRSLVLSMPQRLALGAAQPWVRAGQEWVALKKSPRQHAGVTVLPMRPLRSPDASGADVLARLRVKLKAVAGGRAAETGAGEVRWAYDSVPAVALVGLSVGDIRKLLNQLGLDAAWYCDGTGCRLITRGPEPARDPRDDDAAAAGGMLRDVVLASTSGTDARSPVPAWTTAKRRGWVSGGVLGLACESCAAGLLWCDWWHVDAERMRNSWFVYCPKHGGPVRKYTGRDLLPVIQARRQLDSALCAGSGAGHRFCYVFAVKGLGPNVYYVGESTYEPPVRWAQHRDGVRPAKVLKRPGAAIGPLRPSLLPELPPLMGKEQGLAAEQWVATLLRHRGYVVHGGH